ncbi:MAG: hypothetical protein ABSG17_14305 [Spirochaetia bacterium]|jgi:hypothetical protein
MLDDKFISWDERGEHACKEDGEEEEREEGCQEDGQEVGQEGQEDRSEEVRISSARERVEPTLLSRAGLFTAEHNL